MRIRIIRYLDLVEKKPTGFCYYDVDCDDRTLCRGRMLENDAFNQLCKELKNYLKRNGYLNVELHGK